jgi:phage anti-repressor protein
MKTISSKFIDDFFGLHQFKIDFNEVYIDFDLIVKWLKTRKSDLKSTLVNTYVKKIDYTVEKGKSTGGRPSEIIKLSFDCFRRLCMLSKTKKAEEVRTYFIEIEKHLNKYKDHLIDILNKKIGVLENNQKPVINTKKGVIYVLQTDLEIKDIYKIGKSKAFKNRIKTHNSSHVDNVKIKLIFETNNIDAVEGCLKSLLKQYQYKKRKEFYQVDLDLIKELLKGCEGLTLIRKNNNNKKINKQLGGFFVYLVKD